MPSPIRPTDDEARALARQLIDTARFAGLGVLEDGHPMVTRVALGTDDSGVPISLVSELSHHTKALTRDGRCSLLVGEPGAKGDPLTHPRLTLRATATLIRHSDAGFPALRARYLLTHPKSKLYIDFADFHFARFDVASAYLNGGFGKAFSLTPADLGL